MSYPGQAAPPAGYPAPPPNVGGPVAPSPGQFFSSPEGFQQPHAGQASYNEQDDFNDPSGKYKLVMKGAYAAVECAITPNDLVKAESGAMVTMSIGVDVEAKLEGGAGAACFRSCCAGESLFMSHFKIKPGMNTVDFGIVAGTIALHGLKLLTPLPERLFGVYFISRGLWRQTVQPKMQHACEGDRHDLLLAPAVPGDIMLVHLNGTQDWAIQKSSFMACDEMVSIGVKVQGLSQACCSGEGLFILKAGGQGRLLLNSYGGIIRYDLKPGEVRKIDNGYLVAWHEQMDYKITKAGSSLLGSFLSGEGLVCSFTGPGTVYVQTRSILGLATALAPYIAPAGGGGGGGVDLGGF